MADKVQVEKPNDEEEGEVSRATSETTQAPRRCVADMVEDGRKLRDAHKPVVSHPPIEHVLALQKPLPRPAKPYDCAQCYLKGKAPPPPPRYLPRRHPCLPPPCPHANRMYCSARTNSLAQPLTRYLMFILEEKSHIISPYLRAQLEAKLLGCSNVRRCAPAQVYDRFIAEKIRDKGKMRKQSEKKKGSTHKHTRAMTQDTVVMLARALQRRLLVKNRYQLTGPMLVMSNKVVRDIYCLMGCRVPSRCDKNPKSKFFFEIADKITSWMDEIVREAEDRILQLDLIGDLEDYMKYIPPEDEGKDCLDDYDNASLTSANTGSGTGSGKQSPTSSAKPTPTSSAKGSPTSSAKPSPVTSAKTSPTVSKPPSPVPPK